MKANQIVAIHGNDYLNMTKELLEACRLEDLIPSRNSIITIKPNLVSPSEASWGATTHPEIVAGIIEYLHEKNFYNIGIMEGSWVGDRTSDAYDICGYRELCEKYRVHFTDMQKQRGIEMMCEGEPYQICEIVKDWSDFLINVPVLKGHCQTKVTCALKNLKGLIPNSEKRRFHTLGLHKPIAALNYLIHQDFIVVDNICGDLDFEDGGNPVVMNRILAGMDPVLIDSFACRLLHLKPEDVPYIMESERLGIGSTNLNEMEFISLNADEAAGEVPTVRKVVEIQDIVHEVDSCSACYGSLIPALHRLKEDGLLPPGMEKICIGQGYRGKEGVLGIGQCTSKFQYTLKGCPPKEDEIYEFLKEYINMH